MSYEDFCKAVYCLYPGSEEERKCKDCISTTKQGRTFTRGFQPELWGRILQRFQLKFLDHFPDDPY
ncbi:hypothetical protein HETIRDRAFT_100767 [Heterobasidion irregulare TC 32-1]|uniref:Uncharacterized protein n=1 Tax=Heterobasidion irregulare (strain TC 32-1) TaxID=747525 RepID=W4KIB3_HETIT|nr:uncharacterized protein HETIRDRAFT_100767 [Heterobasidion irregulare TC 32-1]ETW85597.1 hypothetical protein HETIRDRAFT_100767 [Heterobasidion irregulare TC 32-1]